MNLLIASDIHGSELYCGKLVKACYQEQAETLLLLGDILDGNKEVAAMLNTLVARKTFSVFGVTVIIPKIRRCWISRSWLNIVYCLLGVNSFSQLMDIGRSRICHRIASYSTGTLTLQLGSKLRQAISTYVRDQFHSPDETVSAVI